MSTTAPQADWALLEVDGVMEVCENAANKLARNYGSTMEFDDALQEAYLLVALGKVVLPDSEEFGSPLGVLHHRLYMRLVDLVKVEAGKRKTHVSYEAQLDAVVNTIEQ